MKRFWNSYVSLFLVGLFVVLLDQVSKAWVRANIPFGQVWSEWPAELAPYFRLVYWSNSGVAFGMFQGMGYVFAVLAAVVVLVIIYFYRKVGQDDWIIRLAMGMQMGGALGNLTDRITNDMHVIDFISVGTFPVFNVADSSISVGVAILLLDLWLQERASRKSGGLSAGSEEKTPDEFENTGGGSGELSVERVPDGSYTSL